MIKGEEGTKISKEVRLLKKLITIYVPLQKSMYITAGLSFGVLIYFLLVNEINIVGWSLLGLCIVLLGARNCVGIAVHLMIRRVNQHIDTLKKKGLVAK